MNDYVAGALGRERQADYLREVAHDELVARHRRAEAEAAVADRAQAVLPAPHRWRGLLGRLAPSRLAMRLHRP